MPEGAFFFLVLCAFPLFIVIVIVTNGSHFINQAKEWQGFASAHNFTYRYRPSQADPPLTILEAVFTFAPLQDATHVQRWNGMRPFGVGSSVVVKHILESQEDGIPFQAFHYKYSTGSGRSRSVHHVKVAAAQIPIALSRLDIKPQNVFHTIGTVFGLRDLSTESDEFNRAFFVTTDDEQAAYEVLHPKMIEYLLQNPNLDLQIFADQILIIQTGTIDPDFVLGSRAFVQDFYKLIPDYVKNDRKIQKT